MYAVHLHLTDVDVGHGIVGGGGEGGGGHLFRAAAAMMYSLDSLNFTLTVASSKERTI